MITTGDNGNGMVMPVSPMCGNGNGGWGDFGGNGAWWIIILMLFANGGWGNNRGYGGGMVPYMMNNNTNNDVQRGFDQQAVMSGINGITGAINGIGNQLCNSTASIVAAANNGFSAAEISANNRQMSNMQQMFSLQQLLSECCCENRLGIANLNSTILAENCADRAAVSDGIRDILVNQTANTQRLIDTTNQAVQGVYNKLCQLELDAKNDTIADLRNRLNQQTIIGAIGSTGSSIIANNDAQTATVIRTLDPTPVPAYPVQNPNCCNNGQWQYVPGCGCNG